LWEGTTLWDGERRQYWVFGWTKPSDLLFELLWAKNEGRAGVNTVGNVVGHSGGSAVGAHRS